MDRTSKMDVAQKKTSKRSHNKVRVHLPTIESYEKTLEFSAEGPGRVVVRLERLMGSDRIRITDPKYLSTLVERLEAEESKSWGSRSRLRKKAEKNRSRQLAIEGLMEPAEDMQDLYEHPVFRVNRVLNRLALFDTNMTGGGSQKMPPIVQVDLFTTEDDSGKIFKTYPHHQVFHKQVLPYAETRYSRRSTIGRPSTSHVSARKSASPASAHSSHSLRAMGSTSPKSIRLGRKRGVRPGKSAKSTKSLFRAEETPSTTSVKPSGMDVSTHSQLPVREADETAKSIKDSALTTDKSKQFKGMKSSKSKQSGERSRRDDEVVDKEEDGKDSEAKTKRRRDSEPHFEENSESLQDFMLAYGVPSDQNLVQDWQAFKSHLVQRVYEETGGSCNELYELAGHVIGTYDRQLDIVDEFVEVRESSVREERKKKGLPSDPKLVAKILMQERDKNVGSDDDDEEEEGDEEEEDADADKHWNAWSKTKSGGGSKSKDNLSGSKSQSAIGGESKSRTVVEGEDDEEEEKEEEEGGEEEEGVGGISVNVSNTQESLTGEEEAEENEDGEEEEGDGEEQNEGDEEEDGNGEEENENE